MIRRLGPKTTVFIDFDMVIADLHREWVKRYNEATGTEYTPEDIRSWEWPNTVEDPALMWGILHDEDLYHWVDPMPGALRVLRDLREAGIPYVVASSCQTMEQADRKADWLHEYEVIPMGQHTAEWFIPIRHKHLLRGYALVDDYQGNLKRFDGLRVLFDAPYNRGSTFEEHDLRVRGWGALGKLLLSPRFGVGAA